MMIQDRERHLKNATDMLLDGRTSKDVRFSMMACDLSPRQAGVIVKRALKDSKADRYLEDQMSAGRRIRKTLS